MKMNLDEITIVEAFDKTAGVNTLTLTGKDVDFAEIVRLSRLGLWAERHGVPALKRFAEHEPRESAGVVERAVNEAYAKEARTTLAALPPADTDTSA
jgi:hypothetical protein